ncbi:hypothetical protein B484DRAFT_472626 [Ochromonadaceae sp. CCMP2298]|nr:hypothetical protein B484DRAFT_472626 [Ochromonadaceae sp. CCMP2298]
MSTDSTQPHRGEKIAPDDERDANQKWQNGQSEDVHGPVPTDCSSLATQTNREAVSLSVNDEHNPTRGDTDTTAVWLGVNETREREDEDASRDLYVTQYGLDRYDTECIIAVVDTIQEPGTGTGAWADGKSAGDTLGNRTNIPCGLGADRSGVGLPACARPSATRTDVDMSDESKVSLIGAVAGGLAGAEAGAITGDNEGGGADHGALSGSIRGAYAGAKAGAQAAERAGLYWLIKQGAIAGTAAGAAAGAVSGATVAAARQGVVGAVVASQYCDAAATGAKVGSAITRIAAIAALDATSVTGSTAATVDSAVAEATRMVVTGDGDQKRQRTHDRNGTGSGRADGDPERASTRRRFMPRHVVRGDDQQPQQVPSSGHEVDSAESGSAMDQPVDLT